MAESKNKPVYLVDAQSDPVVIRVDGKACFQNSGCLRDFISEMLRHGQKRFVIDFQHCAGMDSTFLGVLAGAAIELKKPTTNGSLVATRASERNQQLLRNVGLHRLMTMDDGSGPTAEDCITPLQEKRCSEIETARLVLKAHEDLVSADEGNRAKFQDVLAFLRQKVEPK